jgi:uncharacterized protein (TIGR01777 family)
MRVAISGASGLIGTELGAVLRRGGHDVLRLVRSRPPGRGAAYWDPASGDLDADALAGCDAVVNLAGKNVGDGRWTEATKRALWHSRVDSTGLLARTMAGLEDGPRVLVSMSGVNIYGDRGDEVLTEASSHGGGFMAELAAAWEAAADPAREAGIRVVHPRGGQVMHPDGGSLRRLLPLFRLGLGGRFGSGRQWWSWVSLDDMVGVIVHALTRQDVDGVLNACAPELVTNGDFTRVLAGVLGRPAVLPIPRLGPRLLVGDLADELIYASVRAVPERTLASGYRFAQPELEPALRTMLGRPKAA